MRTTRQPKSFRQHQHARCQLVTSTILSSLLILSAPIVTTSQLSANNEIASTLPFSNSWETCASHQSCADCYHASHTCHWCAHDGACHAKGSIRTGCVSGASCSGDASPPEKERCSDHASCTECAASSWGCHWCQSDEACHAVGSVHGCASGADCHAIDRCQRLEPERMDDGGTFSKASFRGVGPVAKGVLGVLFGLVLCCSTLCFAGATFMKCAVDDLMGEPAEIVEDGMLISGGQQYERVQSIDEEPDGGQNELEFSLMQNETTANEEAEEGSGKISVEGPPEVLPMSDSRLMRSGAASVSHLSRVSLSSNRVTPRGSSIKRMFFGCQLCYFFSLLTTILLYIVGMSYAPREPKYNVCTNQLAWKSIVEGMASLKMSASFDLLISIYNPNRFEVDLTNGHGQFHHDGEYVGSFEIPEGKISGKAISDIIVKTTFTPDKWSALSLTSEFYRGSLKFLVGGHAHVKIPGLGNYQFDAKFDDIHVNVNDPSLDDTHLCACPGWKMPRPG